MHLASVNTPHPIIQWWKDRIYVSLHVRTSMFKMDNQQGPIV